MADFFKIYVYVTFHLVLNFYVYVTFHCLFWTFCLCHVPLHTSYLCYHPLQIWNFMFMSPSIADLEIHVYVNFHCRFKIYLYVTFHRRIWARCLCHLPLHIFNFMSMSTSIADFNFIYQLCQSCFMSPSIADFEHYVYVTFSLNFMFMSPSIYVTLHFRFLNFMFMSPDF